MLSTNGVGSVSEIMSALLIGLDDKNNDGFSQSELLNIMYDVSSDFSGGEDYCIQYEKQLEQLILEGDKQGAGEMLNKLLGYIY